MANAIPSESEVRAFAEAIGAVDDRGNYTEPKRKLIIGAAAYRDSLAEADGEREQSTARLLADFGDDLIDEGFDDETARQLVIAATPALVQTHGLHVNSQREEPAP